MNVNDIYLRCDCVRLSKNAIRQSIQHDQIFLVKTKSSTLATGRNNALLSQVANFEFFKVGKLS